MNATLTVEMDADVLQRAERAARARSMTLPEAVAHQLTVMAQNWADSHAGKTPVTDELRGTLPLPANADYREILAEELRKKHGG
jgi:hypothetical protein